MELAPGDRVIVDNDETKAGTVTLINDGDVLVGLDSGGGTSQPFPEGSVVKIDIETDDRLRDANEERRQVEQDALDAEFEKQARDEEERSPTITVVDD